MGSRKQKRLLDQPYLINIKPMGPSEAKLLGSEIARMRKAKGLSQEDLARESGVPVRAIRRCEQKGQIPLERYLKLASVLHASARVIAEPTVGHEASTPTFGSIEEVILAGKRQSSRSRKSIRKPRLGGMFETQLRDRPK